jgi:hypothetical protein
VTHDVSLLNLIAKPTKLTDFKALWKSQFPSEQPSPLTRIEEVEQWGMHDERIYRKSGVLRKIRALKIVALDIILSNSTPNLAEMSNRIELDSESHRINQKASTVGVDLDGARSK